MADNPARQPRTVEMAISNRGATVIIIAALRFPGAIFTSLTSSKSQELESVPWEIEAPNWKNLRAPSAVMLLQDYIRSWLKPRFPRGYFLPALLDAGDRLRTVVKALMPSLLRANVVGRTPRQALYCYAC